MKDDLGLCEKCLHLQSMISQIKNAPSEHHLERHVKCSQGFFDLMIGKVSKCSEFSKCKDQVEIIKWDGMTWYVNRAGQMRNYMTSSLEDALDQCRELFESTDPKEK